MEEETYDRLFPTIYKRGDYIGSKVILCSESIIVFYDCGCSNGGEATTVISDSIDAEEVLTLDSDEIKTKNDAITDFKNEMSNKLPVGAKIFSTKERGDILIVESEGEIKKYLVIVEG